MRALALIALLVSSVAMSGPVFRKWRKNDQRRRAITVVMDLHLSDSPPGAIADNSRNAVAITYTRAGSRTCQTSSSAFITLSANQPCVVGGAVLIEDDTTNYAIYSDALDDSSWSASNVDVAPNTGTGPDGAIDAELLSSTSDGGYLELATDFTMTGTLATASAWVRANDVTLSDAKIVLRDTTAGSDLCTTTQSVGTDWTRISCSSSSATSGHAYRIRLYPSAAGQADAYFTAVQAEPNSVATSYVPTGGTSTTRTGDLISFTTPSNWPTSTGCISVTYKPESTSTAPNTITVNGDGLNSMNHFGASGNGWYLNIQSSKVLQLDHRISNSPSTVASAAQTWSNAAPYVLKATWGSSVASLYRDGSALATDQAITTATSNNSTYFIGSRGNGDRFAWGWISALKVGTTRTACD